MNMIRHLRNCQSNVEKRKDYEDRIKKEENQKQREMLISDFGKMTLYQAEMEVNEIKDTKIRENLKEIIVNRKNLNNVGSSASNYLISCFFIFNLKLRNPSIAIL